jgi:hypothetical protein
VGLKEAGRSANPSDARTAGQGLRRAAGAERAGAFGAAVSSVSRELDKLTLPYPKKYMVSQRMASMNIELNERLTERLSKRADANDFDSTGEYTTTLLRTVLDELEHDEHSTDVENRLEDLGYM